MYHFIVNETASSGQCLSVWNSIKSILEEQKVLFNVHFTKSKEECHRIINALSKKQENTPAKHLVVVGGDGTLNTIIQGIDDFSSVKLSLIPAGSGNDFAYALKIPSKPHNAIHHLLNTPSEEVIDCCETTYHTSSGDVIKNRFLISSGTGYDADICEEVNRSSEKSFLNRLRLGKIVYLYIALKKIFRFKKYIKDNECEALLTLDDNQTVHISNMFLTVAMNTPYQGGGTPFCPMADWKDGCLDICSVDNMTTPKLLFCILFIYLKKHFLFRQVNHYRCKKLKIQSKAARWLHTDGEVSHKASLIEMECKYKLHLVK